MAFAALAPGRPQYQPGFEAADTSVTAAVCRYGYHGRTAADDPRSSPAAHVHAGAPPSFVLHGDRDTVTSPAAAREFTARLRAASDRPVVHAELPGAQHSFGHVRSVRARAVVDSVEAFAAWVRSTAHPRRAA